MQGQKALRFHQIYLNLCSENERRSYGLGTTWVWVINDRIFIFGWTIPLMHITGLISACKQVFIIIIVHRLWNDFTFWLTSPSPATFYNRINSKLDPNQVSLRNISLYGSKWVSNPISCIIDTRPTANVYELCYPSKCVHSVPQGLQLHTVRELILTP